MKIVNIDAPYHLVRKLSYNSFEFIIKIIKPLERKFYNSRFRDQVVPYFDVNQNVTLPLTPIRMLRFPCYLNVAVFLHTIPIYLRDSRPEHSRDEDSIIDLLGAYYSNRKGESPYIELYLSEIDNSTNNNEEHFKWLFTKVLIHELAHAALDIFNYYFFRNVTEKVFYHTEFGRWREESMANAIALRIIKQSRQKDFYDYAKNFMLTQPAEYALGVLMENFGYADFENVIDIKCLGADDDLKKEWLNYAKGNPDWEGLERWNRILLTKYVYSYKGKFYCSESELVYDIVDDVLSDYEKKNGTKMDINQFSSLFTNIKIGTIMSYERSVKVKGDWCFKKKISLANGRYSLYAFWNHNLLNKFIDNANFNIKEYQNH